jgi:SAM-dependent methyltransferase
MEFGILECGCSRYPVVGGILILQHVEGLDSVVNSIKRHERQQALLQALKLFRVKWALRSQWHRLRYHLAARRLLVRGDLSFQDAVGLVRKPQVFSDYLLHRYANPSFLAAIGPLLLLGCLEARGQRSTLNGGAQSCSTVSPKADNHPQDASAVPIRVMDLACGAGHCSFLMRQLFPALSVVSVDHDFVSLYLARRYQAPDATHVCLDAEVPSPFADDFFDGVFCLDAFHYLHSKRAIVAELQRVLKPEALWLFPHLHNALQQNITAGVPLSPAHYLDCFGFLKPRLFDEAAILNGLARQQGFDLRMQSPIVELEMSQNLTLIAGPQDLWREHHLFPSAFCKQQSRLVLNPIYRTRSQADKLECTLTWPNQVMRNECCGAEAVLPATCQLSRNELRRLLQEPDALDDARLRELVAKFVLVPLPADYCRHEATGV